MTFAGRRVYALVYHIGRRSGRSYTTPVLAMPTSDGFVIPLPYGVCVDWCQNVMAAEMTKMMWQGDTFTISDPRLAVPSDVIDLFPRWLHFLLHRTEVYLQVKRGAAEMSDGLFSPA